jgi:hypothetical protein
LLTSSDDLEVQGLGVLLLHDLRDLFATDQTDRLTTATIIERLNQIEDRPWSDERKGRGVNANWLSRKLRAFSIYPRTIRTGVGQGETAKGYLLGDFDEAFGRYLPETPSANRNTVTSHVNTGENPSFETVTAATAVTVPNPHKTTGNIELLPCDGSESIPPPDLPLVPLKPTPTPAQRKMVTAYLTRQCGNAQLREWLTRRKSAYASTPMNTWDPTLVTYAAARDAACWQLDRPEPEVWFLLEGIESCVTDLKSKRMI